MLLSEGLEELRENLLRDNAELASGPEDQLWTDPTLVRYLTDAQRRWARQSLTLRDGATPSVCEVELETGVTEYTLHKSVRAVISARYEDNTLDLRRVGHTLLNEGLRGDDDSFDVNSASAITGAPVAYTTDERFDLEEDSAVVLRVYGTPTTTENGKLIYLRVARMPLRTLKLSDTKCRFEIPDEFCLDMLEWAAYRAKRTSDIDGHHAQADEHKLRFDKAVLEARKTNRNKLAAPIKFQFGSGGTAWER